ncbi:FkbM family methyltransferase [Asaia sp. As-1742]|uniref:FkbM family methyltransferase n=1 Tax=Asaia sp. As-1742 TaxID=2608325 RepID=UPI001420BFD1|nr:FkbM family methyltransferase [Asaia sp. As-1742]
MKEINTRYGALKVPVDENDLIARFLVHYGEWAWDEVSFIASVVPEQARVLDIGACFGTFGIGLSLLSDLSEICFVDGNPAVIPCLTENVGRNIKAKATVKEAIVGRPGLSVSDVHADPENIGSASFAPDETAAPSDLATSHVRSLKEIWDEKGPFDLIKIDAEGMELSIIDSHARELATGKTALWLECNEDERSLALCDRLLSWDLDIYYFAFPSHNPDNFRQEKKVIFPFAYEAGLLVAPSREPVMSDTLRAHGCILKRIETVEMLRSSLWETPRWGYADWQGKSVPELAALAGHALRDENFSEFLRHGWKNKTPLTQVRHSLEAELERLAGEMQDHKSASQIALNKVMEQSASHQRAVLAVEEEKASLRRIVDEMELRLVRQDEEARVQAERIGELEKSLDDAAVKQSEAASYAKSLERKISSLTVEMFDQVAEATRRYETTHQAGRTTEYVYVTSGAPVETRVIDSGHAEQVAFLQERVRSMEISTTWRLTAPLRSMIAGFPNLHKGIRFARRTAARVRDQYRRI